MSTTTATEAIPRDTATGRTTLPRNVRAYLAGLRTVHERRYATKEYRRVTGVRKTRPTGFHLTHGRARSIRVAVAALAARRRA